MKTFSINEENAEALLSVFDKYFCCSEHFYLDTFRFIDNPHQQFFKFQREGVFSDRPACAYDTDIKVDGTLIIPLSNYYGVGQNHDERFVLIDKTGQAIFKKSVEAINAFDNKDDKWLEDCNSFLEENGIILFFEEDFKMRDSGEPIDHYPRLRSMYSNVLRACAINAEEEFERAEKSAK